MLVRQYCQCLLLIFFPASVDFLEDFFFPFRDPYFVTVFLHECTVFDLNCVREVGFSLNVKNRSKVFCWEGSVCVVFL